MTSPEAAPRCDIRRFIKSYRIGHEALGHAHYLMEAVLEDGYEVREAEAAAGTALDLLRRLVAVVDAGHIWWDEPVPSDSMAALHDAKDYLARLAGVESDRQPVADASEDEA